MKQRTRSTRLLRLVVAGVAVLGVAGSATASASPAPPAATAASAVPWSVDDYGEAEARQFVLTDIGDEPDDHIQSKGPLGTTYPSSAPLQGRPTPTAALASMAGGNDRHESPFRTIITTDASRFRFDDTASFYRFLLYSNEFADSLEGIVYSSSFVPVAPGTWDTDLFQRIVRDEYSLVYENLRLHDPRYPSPDQLLSLIKVGNISATNEMATDTQGSLLIKEALLSDDPRPLRLQVWGGTNTIAAALRSITEEYSSSPDWQEIKQRISDKSELYITLDQDVVFKNYIETEWPELDATVNRAQFTAVAYPRFRIGPSPTLPEELDDYFKTDFMNTIAHGPLLANMPRTIGDPLTSDGACYCEGDSPAFWELIDTGLRSYEDPAYGGWGGRFVQTSENRWSDWPAYMDRPTWPGPGNAGLDPTGRVADESPYGDQFDPYYPQSRWIPVIQNDFAARSQWQYLSYQDANHHPVVSVPEGKLNISAKPRQRVQLVGHATDPDGDTLTAQWWQYAEAGTYAGQVAVADPTALRGRGANVVVPRDAKAGDTIHLILEVTDDGEIPLTRYQRVIITVR